MSGPDELLPPDEDHRQRHARLTPRLRFDSYLLVWDTPLPRDLRRFNPVPPHQAQAVLQRWFRHGSRFFWHDAQRFYCKMRNQPQHELMDFRDRYIERWFLSQLDARMGHLRLLKRKPLELTGRFAERVPEEQAGDAPPEAHWVGLDLVDQDGNRVPEAEYQLRLPDERVLKRATRNGGTAKLDGIEQAGSSEWKLLEKQPEPGA